MKKILKKIIPRKIINFYHFCLAMSSAIFYGFPANKMLIVGITGTKGKTSTSNFIWSVLNSSGIKTGIISTANIRVGDEEISNTRKMTMPGRFVIQKYLKEMLKKGISVVVVETTSQGILQFRHRGISYDVAIFTNLSPEHIESHGGYENYKKAKKVLFNLLPFQKIKSFNGKIFPKTIIANKDDKEFSFYTDVNVPRIISFGIESTSDFKAENIKESGEGIIFSLEGEEFKSSIFGKFNVYNILPAIALGKILGLGLDKIKEGVLGLKKIPGRMEEIKNEKGFKIFVDYAHEPKSLESAIKASRVLAGDKKVIVLCGSQGGGRDVFKRGEIGKVAGTYADFVIVSNEDPYEDDPMEIINYVKKGVLSVLEKEENKNVFGIEDRKKGIEKALSLANTGDVVLITGKGSEETMIIKDGAIPWSDKKVVLDLIK